MVERFTFSNLANSGAVRVFCSMSHFDGSSVYGLGEVFRGYLFTGLYKGSFAFVGY
jgi:hypothetical protein